MHFNNLQEFFHSYLTFFLQCKFTFTKSVDLDEPEQAKIDTKLTASTQN